MDMLAMSLKVSSWFWFSKGIWNRFWWVNQIEFGREAMCRRVSFTISMMNAIQLKMQLLK